MRKVSTEIGLRCTGYRALETEGLKKGKRGEDAGREPLGVIGNRKGMGLRQSKRGAISNYALSRRGLKRGFRKRT